MKSVSVNVKKPFIVFELLSYSLFDMLKNTEFEGIPLRRVRRIGYQIFEALEFLKSLKIVHTDLKPENIVFCDSFLDNIKLVDFGQAISMEKFQQPCQTLFYRAPEIFLNLKADYSIDVWSVGCILAELFTGSVLFYGGSASSIKQFHSIIKMLGYPSNLILNSSSYTKFYLKQKTNGEWCLPSLVDKIYSLSQFRLECSQAMQTYFKQKRLYDVHDRGLISSFRDLLEKILVYHPKERITPVDAINHDFFHLLKETTCTEENETIN